MNSNLSEQFNIISTKDGSHTVFSKYFRQHYHNPNGAISESRHVFFETSGILDTLKKNKPVNLFETGFGTGLNFLLLFEYAERLNSESKIHYATVEKNPIPFSTAKKLNYPDFLQTCNSEKLLETIFDTAGQNSGLIPFEVTRSFALDLFVGSFEDLPSDIPKEPVNYIFHDPFSPEVNPELWDVTVFQQLKSSSKADVRLVTYGAASKARAAMAKAGWHVARAPGALGKREMTVAALQPEELEKPGWKRVNEKRLSERFFGSDPASQ